MSHKTLLSMFHSSRYSSRANESAVAARAGDSLAAGESRSSMQGAPHSRPFWAQHTDVLDVPQPDEQFLCVMGEKMLRKARAVTQPLSMVVMQVYDLPEVELVFGGAGAARAIHRVMSQLARAAICNGFVVRSAVDTFALLVPGAGTEATVAAIYAQFGKPCVIEFESDGDEVLLMPDVRVHTFRADESLQQVYERVCRLIAKERGREKLRCDYIRRERESYTRPMGLPLVPCSVPSTELYYPVLPATIPVPMGRH